MPTATTMTSKEIVRAKYPHATANGPLIGGWEITETEDTETSTILGSGFDLPTTWEQDEIDYKGTEEAAWDDAARTIRAQEKVGDLARNIVNQLFDLGDVSVDRRQAINDYADAFVARLIYDAQVPEELREMAERIRTQDNLATADPTFTVYEKRTNRSLGRFVQTCFTRAGAEKYIWRNGHNLKNPYIYVDSMYRNDEMIGLREFLGTL